MILSSFFRKTSAGNRLIAVNSVIAVLFGISLLLNNAGLPYITIPFGILALLAPGICLAVAVEQLTESKIDSLFFFLWIILFSLIVTPAAISPISLLVFHQNPVDHVTLPFFAWWTGIFLIGLIICTIKRQVSSLDNFKIDQKTKHELLWICIGFLIIMALNFLLYPLLPEADGYLLLAKWRTIQIDPRLISVETRLPFLMLVNLYSEIVKIDPYWLLKVILPLFHITLAIACYLFSRTFLSDSRYRVIASLAPFYFPIVLLESLISRPQSIFLIAFLPVLIIISDILPKREKVRNVYWLFALLIIGGIGTKIHTLFAIIALIALVSILIFLLGEIKKRTIDSIIIVIALAGLIYPIVNDTRIIPDAWHLIVLFATSIQHNHFVFWFIDHYKNVDGTEVGWPGWSALFYYGYNLGVALGAFVIWIVIARKPSGLKQLFIVRYWAILFLLVFFLFIAEIAPHFELAYLPDRAWLFLSLILALWVPILLSNLIRKTKFNLIAVSIICVISILIGSGLTYAKQGWVTLTEVKAAKFIRQETPDNALFLGQGSSKVMIRYYAKRTFIHPPADVFIKGDTATLEAYLKRQQTERFESLRVIVQRKNNLSYWIEGVGSSLRRPDLSDDELRSIFDALAAINDRRNEFFSTDDINTPPDNSAPVYLIYNTKKFSSLYGGRSWWRTSNFYGANLDEINKNHSLIYNNDGILIWKVSQ